MDIKRKSLGTELIKRFMSVLVLILLQLSSNGREGFQ